MLPRLVLICCLFLAWSAPAQAAARLVLSMAESANVYIDGQLVHAAPSGPRATATLTAGSHLVEITDQTNQSIFLTYLDVPEGAEVKASFARGSGLVVVGPQGAVRPPEAGAGMTADDDGTEAAVPDESTFDMNEGTPNPQRETESRYGGNYTAWSSTTSAVGQGVGTATGIGSPSLGRVVPSAASGLSNTLRTAEAGGTDALRRSSGNSWRQGRPIPPKAKTGTVALEHVGEAPLTIYIEGFQVAELSQAGSGKVTLEVGAHELTIFNAATNSQLWAGRLKIEEGVTLPLVFSETEAPRATDRVWLYSPR